MKSRPLITALAILFTITLIAPPVFFIAPQKTHAYWPTVEVPGPSLFAQIKTSIEEVWQTISGELTKINTATTAWAQTLDRFNKDILEPLAFVLSGNLLKMITAATINFVIGKTNGTGVPQFVVDVQKSLQTVSDARALAFFNQYGKNSNSPFASSISSSLRSNYLSKTTLAGFWAANMNTLARSTPSYAPGYLTGNWSQGGVAAWFALTTKVENNPYTLYQNSQNQLGTMLGNGVGGATGARLAELGWGQGMMSWCGSKDSATAAANYAATQSSVSTDASYQKCIDNGGTEDQCQTMYTTPVTVSGVNPGDPCKDKDGNPGTIKTPGSVITSALNKALGTDQDRLIRMGNVGPEITSILRNVTVAFQTVNLVNQILGGLGSGGLLGADQPSGSNSTSRLTDFVATPSLGVTSADIYKNAATMPMTGADMLARVAGYEASWNTIKGAADAAKGKVDDLITFCNTAVAKATTDPLYASIESSAKAQVVAAQTALQTKIAPVLAKAAGVPGVVKVARDMAQAVQTELNAPSADAATKNAVADIQTLQSMPPTNSDVANAQQDAQSFGGAQASPEGSLNVSGSSLVDQMNLISTNAAALKASACSPSSAGDGGSF